MEYILSIFITLMALKYYDIFADMQDMKTHCFPQHSMCGAIGFYTWPP